MTNSLLESWKAGASCAKPGVGGDRMRLVLSLYSTLSAEKESIERLASTVKGKEIKIQLDFHCSLIFFSYNNVIRWQEYIQNKICTIAPSENKSFSITNVLMIHSNLSS